MQQDPVHGGFEAPILRVESGWIDKNGHMNVAFYLRAFDLAGDEMYRAIGLGWDYSAGGVATTFTLETRIQYVQEVFLGDPLRITGQIADVSEKVLHFVSHMYHAEKGYLAAATEALVGHVSLATRKIAPFPPEIHARLVRICDSQRHLPRPAAFARPLGIRR